MNQKLKCLSGAVLKNIAVVTMVIDHFTCVVLAAYIRTFSRLSLYSFPVYKIGRTIGRIAFPIYCFLIAEGAFHTRNRMKYLFRMLGCALLSIVPFSLAIYGEVFSLSGQNVFFSLSLGLAAIFSIEELQHRLPDQKVLAGLLGLLAFLVFTGIAAATHCDYRSMGPVLMVSFYLGRKSKLETAIFGTIGFLVGTFSQYFFSYYARYGYYANIFRDVIQKGIPLEIWGMLAIPLVLLYNGERGKQLPKSFYYLFYPIHLALFAAIKMIWLQ